MRSSPAGLAESAAAWSGSWHRREDPANDAESTRLARASRQAFADAAALLDRQPAPCASPYEGTTLPGCPFLVDDSGTSRPTVIFHGGHDSAHRCGAAVVAKCTKRFV